VLDLEDPNTFIESAREDCKEAHDEDLNFDPQLQELAQRLKKITQIQKSPARTPEGTQRERPETLEATYHPLLASPEPPLLSSSPPGSADRAHSKIDNNQSFYESPKVSPSKNSDLLNHEDEKDQQYDGQEDGLELLMQSSLSRDQRRESTTRRDTSAEALALSLLARPSRDGGAQGSYLREARVCDLQWLVGDFDTSSRVPLSVLHLIIAKVLLKMCTKRLLPCYRPYLPCFLRTVATPPIVLVLPRTSLRDGRRRRTKT